MNEALIGIVIFMLGFFLGDIIGLVILLIIHLRKKLEEKRLEDKAIQEENEHLKDKVEELTKSYEELLRELTSNEPKNYSNAFEFTSAVLEGKEDF